MREKSSCGNKYGERDVPTWVLKMTAANPRHHYRESDGVLYEQCGHEPQTLMLLLGHRPQAGDGWQEPPFIHVH